MIDARTQLAAALAGLCLHTAASAAISGAEVKRSGVDALGVTWSSPDPVDLYEADRPDAQPAAARLLAHGSRAGAYAVDHAGRQRIYFVLVDERDHETLKVAERLVPLQQGSNFRDIGGYPAAGGRHVRWGLIYRSGAQPMLTADDLAELHAMGLAQIVDLRSKEERVLAPTAIDGVPYTAIGYSMMDLMKPAGGATLHNGVALYRNFPHFLAPQLKVLFADLLSRRTPIAYNCSAGQDRTGFATAMILSALGVPRQVIYADYQLSTAYRRPEFEMPKIDLAAHPNDPAAQLFAHYNDHPELRKPQPLVEADGRPFLMGAFDEIDAKWGSVDAYLREEIGLTPADIAALRKIYLE
jgi:protein-tyrosine phosphatase